jgi:hypothetical protein
VPGFQPSISQKVRTALIESGNEDLVNEIYTDALSQFEERIYVLERDVRLLQQAEQDRITRSGVWTIVKGKLDSEAVDWMRWAARITAGAIIGAVVTGIFWFAKYLWSSSHGSG